MAIILIKNLDYPSIVKVINHENWFWSRPHRHVATYDWSSIDTQIKMKNTIYGYLRILPYWRLPNIMTIFNIERILCVSICWRLWCWRSDKVLLYSLCEPLHPWVGNSLHLKAVFQRFTGWTLTNGWPVAWLWARRDSLSRGQSSSLSVPRHASISNPKVLS